MADYIDKHGNASPSAETIAAIKADATKTAMLNQEFATVEKFMMLFDQQRTKIGDILNRLDVGQIGHASMSSARLYICDVLRFVDAGAKMPSVLA